jgi:hypothetical protein
MPRELIPFDFEMPLEVFEKADASEGKQRRIGGLASVGTKDRQDETIIQRGLDFSDFVANGWFNDNRSKVTTDILGYPDGDTPPKYVQKGTMLPSGRIAKGDGHWVEGYLLNTEKADRIWELGQALQKTNRRLGFSVEGKIQKRIGPDNRTIAKALVRNVAITNCPVHPDARMEILAKSLVAVEQSDPDELEKMLTMGTATPGQAPTGVKTGEGAGQVLAPESLEQDSKPPVVLKDKEDEEDEKTKKSLTDSEVRAWFKARLPKANSTQLDRVVVLTRALKRAGKL